MGRLIDADALKREADITNWDKPFGVSLELIDSQPTIESVVQIIGVDISQK